MLQLLEVGLLANVIILAAVRVCGLGTLGREVLVSEETASMKWGEGEGQGEWTEEKYHLKRC